MKLAELGVEERALIRDRLAKRLQVAAADHKEQLEYELQLAEFSVRKAKVQVDRLRSRLESGSPLLNAFELPVWK